MLTSVVLLALLSASTVDGTETVQQFINDNNVLNYALTLENFEAAYYAQGLTYFGASDFNYTAAGFPSGTYATLSLIGAQEKAHAALLTQVLGLRGYPAVPACTYSFSYTDAGSFISQLVQIEGVGSAAYAGAANSLTSAYLLTTAAGIATVEAKHTAVLNTTINYADPTQRSAAPFPFDLNPIYTAAQAYAAVSPFFISCPSASLVVSYSNSANVTVTSSNPTTYAFQDALSLRGNSSIESGPTYYNSTPAGQAAQANDFAVLNYALTLEYLESTFYNQTISSYAASAITAAYPNANASFISASIGLIAGHEAAHVSFLKGFLGASATQPCSYNFGVPAGNFTAFVQVAYTLESTGVQAYVGAISLLTNPFVAQIAATVAEIEGRHTAYLYNLLVSPNATIYGNTGSVSYSGSVTQPFDLPLTPSAVVSTLLSKGLITSCPSTNPPVWGINITATQQDFFNDNSLAATQPFPVGSGTNSNSATNTVSTNGGPTSSGTNPTATNPTATNPTATTTSSASAISACVALVFALALFVF